MKDPNEGDGERRVGGGLRNTPDDAPNVGSTGKWSMGGGLTGRSVPSNHRADWISEHSGKLILAVILVAVVGGIAYVAING